MAETSEPPQSDNGRVPAGRGRRWRLLPASRRGRLAVAAILCAGLAAGVMLQNWADNQSSHYDLIRALAAGRENIDAGPYPTKDEAYYKGHWYSAPGTGPCDLLAALL